MSPFADIDRAAGWAAAILGRLLLLPNDDELHLLGSFKHDVNLGTVTLAPMLDAGLVERLQVAAGLPATCTSAPPPMWLGGCFSTLSPAHAFLYLLFGANRLPPGIFGDVKAGQIKIGLFAADGGSSLEPALCYRTGLGELRVRFAISARMQVRTVVVPIPSLAMEGLIDGVVVQDGETVHEASANPAPIAWPADQLRSAGLERSGRYFRATTADAALIIDVGQLEKPIAIFSIAVRPLALQAPPGPIETLSRSPA